MIWWAWVDLNHRPRPYQGCVNRFYKVYKNLQDRGDCQTPRKSCKTSHFVGWVVGWKISGKRCSGLLIAGEVGRDGSQFLVLIVTAIDRVESRHPQIGRQPAELSIRNKSQLAERLRPQAHQRRYVHRFERRVHANSVAIFYAVPKIHRFAVDENKVQFRVRHAEGFNQVFNRLLTSKS